MFAKEHQACRPPNVDKGKDARDHVAARQRPTQPRRPANPAELVGKKTDKHRNRSCCTQQDQHRLKRDQRRRHADPEDPQGQAQRHEAAKQQAQEQPPGAPYGFDGGLHDAPCRQAAVKGRSGSRHPIPFAHSEAPTGPFQAFPAAGARAQ